MKSDWPLAGRFLMVDNSNVVILTVLDQQPWYQSLMKKSFHIPLIVSSLLLFSAAASAARQFNPADINLPSGYKIEAAVTGLASPTMVAFDDQGRMIIAESGYDQGGDAAVSRIEKNGHRTTLLKQDKLGKDLPLTSVAFYQGKVYVVHGGSVSTIDQKGSYKTIVSGIPFGDHQADQIVFKGGYAYLSVGTVTNSAVVGPDNAVFGWLKDPANRQLHDVPCVDLQLSDQTFGSEDVTGNTDNLVQTSPYSAFGSTSTFAKGNSKCNGSILKFRPDGSNLSVYAWGFRNPYGLEIGSDGNLYITMHGFDARGSRPIENAWDCLYKVQPGAWYGWPDFACEVPVTDPRFKTQDKPQPQFVIKNHPTENPPVPIAKFDPHSATNGFAFAPSSWGETTDVYIALFGDFTPATGTTTSPQGVKIVKVDTTNGTESDFISNKIAGQASRHNAGGLEHPSDVTFGPDGAMYIADWGIARVSTEGLKLDKDSGVIWKVTKSSRAQNYSSGFSSPALALPIIVAVALGAVTLLVGFGKSRFVGWGLGIVQGIIAGIIGGIVTLLISTLALQLPWHTPPRVLATIVMGKSAIANVLEFDFWSTIVGVIVLLILSIILAFIFNLIVRAASRVRIIVGGILFGLTIWVILQYFVFTYGFPLVVEKGFPPGWYAATFGVIGLVIAVIRTIIKPTNVSGR